jgi:hypothetical protein
VLRGAVVVVARGSVEVAPRPRIRLQLRTTAAAKRLLPGMRRAWFRVSFSGADRAASIRHVQRIVVRRSSQGP